MAKLDKLAGILIRAQCPSVVRPYAMVSRHAPQRRLVADDERRRRLIIFCIPLLGLIKIDLIGELYGSEVALWIIALLAISRRVSAVSRTTAYVIVAGLFWFLAQLVSDVANGSSFIDGARGLAKILSFLICIYGFSVLVNNVRYLNILFVAMGVFWGGNSIITYIGELDLGLLWKFGLGHMFVVLAIFFSGSGIFGGDRFLYRRLATVLSIVAMVSFSLNSRNLAALTLVCSAIFLYMYFNSAKGGVEKVGAGSLYVILFLVSIASFYIYVYGAESGLFGEDARDKLISQMQSGHGMLGLLAGGRPEILVSLEAIKDAPLLGHGSWAKNYYYSELLNEIRSIGFGEQSMGTNYSALDGLIPSHSYLFGAWVEAGIVGAGFWLFILLISVKTLTMAVSRQVSHAGFVVFFLCVTFWNVAFSPFGGADKITVAATLVALALVRDSSSASRP